MRLWSAVLTASVLLAGACDGATAGDADAEMDADGMGGDGPGDDALDRIEALDAPSFDPAVLPQGDPPVRPPIRAIVVSVIDGDTFNVRLADGSEERVRFLSIDAPEMYPRGADPECYAMEAHRRVEELTPPGTPVWLTFDSVALDRYGRSLAHVFAGDRPVAGFPDWINLRLVEEGYARAYVFSDNATFRGTFERTEAEAAAAGRGLWVACPP